VSARSEATRAALRGKALALGAAAGALLLLSGAIAAVYVRPYGHHPVGHVRLAVGATAALRGVHVVGAAALVLAAVAAGVLGRSWRRSALRARPEWSLAALLGLLTLLTGLLIPWQSLLPWSPLLGPNLARPVPLLGYEGPFTELTGVTMRYDDALLSLGRWRVGPKGVGRLYFAHLVVLPLLAMVAVWLGRRRRRVAAVTEEGVRPEGDDPR
jgi:hypothetical protein